MSEEDKTNKAIPLEYLPEVKMTEDETLATAGVFRRFALWLLKRRKLN